MKYTSWVDAPELGHRLDPYRYDPVFIGAHRRLTTQVATASLESLTTAPINYGILQPREFRDIGIPMVRAVDLGNPTVDWAEVRKVPPEVETPYRRSRLAAGDVLLSIAGTLGAVGIVPTGPSVANVNQSVARIRPSPALDGGFLAAFLMTRLGQTILEREAVGSVQRHLNIEDVRTLRIPTPANGIDRAIGNKLRKAERLRALAAAGRHRAQIAMNAHAPRFVNATAMTSWVRPETMDERMDTQPYRSHFLSLAQALRSAGAVEVREVATVSGGDPVSSEEFRQSGVPLVRIRDIQPGGFGPSDDSVTNEYFQSRPAAAARHGRIVVGMDGEFRAQFFIESDLPRLVNQRVAIIDCFGIRPELLVAWLNRPEGQLQLARWAVQTTVAHTSLEHIRSLRVPRMPPSEEEAAAEGLLLARRAVAEAATLVEHARASVEALINGTLDEPALLAESDAIEAWLVANPSPDAKA